jgi:hypothetical protein
MLYYTTQEKPQIIIFNFKIFPKKFGENYKNCPKM